MTAISTNSGMHRELPGHIRKAFRSIERFLPVVDLLIELADARMPGSSRISGFVTGLGKPSLLVLGKADLADPELTSEWVSRFEEEGTACVALDAKAPASVKGLLERLQRLLSGLPSSSGTPGPGRPRRLMVIGIPNVGKSTLINSLAGRRAARVANLPGVTRDIQWIKLAGRLELLDLPGVLDFNLLKRGTDLRLINTVPGPEDDPFERARRLCTLVSERGGHPDFPAAPGAVFSEFLDGYARGRHFLLKGGDPDHTRAAIDLVHRFQQGKLGRISLEAPSDPAPASFDGREEAE